MVQFWVAGDYTVTLNVTDEEGNWEIDEVVISVIEESSSGGNNNMWPLYVIIMIIVVILLFLIMKQRKLTAKIEIDNETE